MQAFRENPPAAKRVSGGEEIPFLLLANSSPNVIKEEAAALFLDAFESNGGRVEEVVMAEFPRKKVPLITEEEVVVSVVQQTGGAAPTTGSTTRAEPVASSTAGSVVPAGGQQGSGQQAAQQAASQQAASQQASQFAGREQAANNQSREQPSAQHQQPGTTHSAGIQQQQGAQQQQLPPGPNADMISQELVNREETYYGLGDMGGGGAYAVGGAYGAAAGVTPGEEGGRNILPQEGRSRTEAGDENGFVWPWESWCQHEGTTTATPAKSQKQLESPPARGPPPPPPPPGVVDGGATSSRNDFPPPPPAPPGVSILGLLSNPGAGAPLATAFAGAPLPQSRAPLPPPRELLPRPGPQPTHALPPPHHSSPLTGRAILAFVQACSSRSPASLFSEDLFAQWALHGKTLLLLLAAISKIGLSKIGMLVHDKQEPSLVHSLKEAVRAVALERNENLPKNLADDTLLRDIVLGKMLKDIAGAVGAFERFVVREMDLRAGVSKPLASEVWRVWALAAGEVGLEVLCGGAIRGYEVESRSVADFVVERMAARSRRGSSVDVGGGAGGFVACSEQAVRWIPPADTLSAAATVYPPVESCEQPLIPPACAEDHAASTKSQDSHEEQDSDDASSGSDGRGSSPGASSESDEEPERIAEYTEFLEDQVCQGRMKLHNALLMLRDKGRKGKGKMAVLQKGVALRKGMSDESSTEGAWEGRRSCRRGSLLGRRGTRAENKQTSVFKNERCCRAMDHRLGGFSRVRNKCPRSISMNNKWDRPRSGGTGCPRSTAPGTIRGRSR